MLSLFCYVYEFAFIWSIFRLLFSVFVAAAAVVIAWMIEFIYSEAFQLTAKQIVHFIGYIQMIKLE